MAGLSDILTAIQNGVTALNNLGAQVRGSFNNISSQLTALQAQSYKISSFTRVLSVASGNASYTGIGFRPRLILFTTAISGGSTWSSTGRSDGVNNTSLEISLNTGGTIGAYTDTTTAGRQRDDAAGANYQQFVVSSFDADGFTLAWTKVGVPTATAELNVVCFR